MHSKPFSRPLRRLISSYRLAGVAEWESVSRNLSASELVVLTDDLKKLWASLGEGANSGGRVGIGPTDETEKTFPEANDPASSEMKSSKTGEPAGS